MRTRTRWIAGLSAATILLTVVATVSAYDGQVAATGAVAVQGDMTCGEPMTLEATFVDSEGAPVPELSVEWTFATSQSDEDSFDDSTTVTNDEGATTNEAVLAEVSGERTIRATADEASASVVVTQVCVGLPRTSTILPRPFDGAIVALLLVLTSIGLVARAAVLLRRRA